MTKRGLPSVMKEISVIGRGSRLEGSAVGDYMRNGGAEQCA